MADWLTPYYIPHDHCLSIGQAPSQGLVYAIDENIVVKVPFQYPIADNPDSEAELYRDDSLRSFELLRKEATIYRILALRPHPHIVRRLYTQPAPCLFLERAANPLQLAQAQATTQLRYRWIRQLLSAVTWLEELGYAHGDLAIQNIGIDNHNCLKLFDLGNATNKADETFHYTLEKDHLGLANCLYFLLSGVDPLANAKDWSEVRCIQRELNGGQYKVVPEAKVLKEVILDGWTGVAAHRTFREIREMVERDIGTGDDASLHSPAPKDYRGLEAACAEWLDRATLESRWLSEQQYRAKWRSLGYDIEEGIWGDGLSRLGPTPNKDKQAYAQWHCELLF
ncbi:MAG: hypothetical protein LQ343_000978 [Gyalolechia ehrenbergii]|nr:MAG: hypothetical protein LQ343_000978 [Gyalolechia ehrenbergii]